MYRVLTLNNIRPGGLARLPRDRYEIANDLQNPDAVLLRSFNMHDWSIPDSLKAVGRAGVGVNNIPIAKLSARGIPIFNTPGANANAVKELVLTGMLLAARNILPAWDYVRELHGTDKEITEQVEANKKRFAGFELPQRTLGVIGLGSIGVQVANAAIALGMRVVGYDPHITVNNAWRMSAQVEQVGNVNDVLAQSEFVSLHVPLIDATRNLINKESIQRCRQGLTLLNFSRQGIVDDEAVSSAIKNGKIHAYVCDFPSNLLINHERVITLPHLGASTEEAEENCAVMVAEQIRDYLENGAIRNSVNFPDMYMPRTEGCRLMAINANVPHMIERISAAIARMDLNIVDLLNKSRGELACTIVDVECAVAQSVVDEIAGIEGVLTVRLL